MRRHFQLQILVILYFIKIAIGTSSEKFIQRVKSNHYVVPPASLSSQHASLFAFPHEIAKGIVSHAISTRKYEFGDMKFFILLFLGIRPRCLCVVHVTL